MAVALASIVSVYLTAPHQTSSNHKQINRMKEQCTIYAWIQFRFRFIRILSWIEPSDHGAKASPNRISIFIIMFFFSMPFIGAGSCRLFRWKSFVSVDCVCVWAFRCRTTRWETNAMRNSENSKRYLFRGGTPFVISGKHLLIKFNRFSCDNEILIESGNISSANTSAHFAHCR